MTYVPATPMAAPDAGTAAPAIAPVAESAAVRVLDYRCGATACAAPVAARHDRTSLILLTRGAFCYADHGYTRLLEPGALVVGLAGDEYACSHEYGGGDACLVFQFAPGVLETALGDKRPRAGAVLAGDPRLEALAGAARAGMSAEALEESAYALAEAAAERLGAGAEVPPSLRRADRDRAHQAVQLIESRHAEGLTIGAIAEAVDASPFHFLRVFRQELGVTPHQYLLRTRLRRAVAMLRDSAAPVTEIAYTVGFGDLSNFHRAFKRHLGCSPEAFRRRA